MQTQNPFLDEFAKITSAAMGLAQTASEEAKAAIGESVRRISSIALVHDILAREPGEDLPFIEVLRPLVRMVEESLSTPERTVSFELTGDPGTLPAAVATPMAVVLNAPISNVNLKAVAMSVDIPVVITVVSSETNIPERVASGAAIVNVAGGKDNAALVRRIREKNPDVPIIATGGRTNESVHDTIVAGANAITYTPPSTAELFSTMMTQYRDDSSQPQQRDYNVSQILRAVGALRQ